MLSETFRVACVMLCRSGRVGEEAYALTLKASIHRELLPLPHQTALGDLFVSRPARLNERSEDLIFRSQVDAISIQIFESCFCDKSFDHCELPCLPQMSHRHLSTSPRNLPSVSGPFTPLAFRKYHSPAGGLFCIGFRSIVN